MSTLSSYLPGKHSEHDICRPSAFVTMPSPQRVQFVWPVLVVYQSEGHPVHFIVCVLFAKVPSVQGTHSTAPSAAL